MFGSMWPSFSSSATTPTTSSPYSGQTSRAATMWSATSSPPTMIVLDLRPLRRRVLSSAYEIPLPNSKTGTTTMLKTRDADEGGVPRLAAKTPPRR